MATCELDNALRGRIQFSRTAGTLSKGARHALIHTDIVARVADTGIQVHEHLIHIEDMGEVWDGEEWHLVYEYEIKPIEQGFRVLSDFLESYAKAGGIEQWPDY